VQAQATTTSDESSSATSAEPGAGSAKLAADPSGELRYTTKPSLTSKAGRVTIDFTNNSPIPHNLTVATSQGNVLGATPTFRGGSRGLTLNLKPGTYTFYCSVPGHRQAGMQGTLVVK
jgi:plastocyanin